MPVPSSTATTWRRSAARAAADRWGGARYCCGMNTADAVTAIARDAKVASRALASATRAEKDAALHAMADALLARADALAGVGLPRNLVQSIDAHGREGAVALMHARGLVDVLVPRGGADLIQTVVRESTVPAIETGVGNCHVYVDESADIAMARRIIMNSKVQRPGVCNAAETLLVHRGIAAEFLPLAARDLVEAGVTLHADDDAARLAGVATVPAGEEDWATEYLSLDLAVRVVDDLDAAIEHVRTWSSGHTEAIVTSSLAAAGRWTRELDAAALIVNASTRFTDGGQFGLGAVGEPR